MHKKKQRNPQLGDQVDHAAVNLQALIGGEKAAADEGPVAFQIGLHDVQKTRY